MTYSRRAGSVLLCVAAGCVTSLDEDHLVDLTPPFADVSELCVVTPPDGVSLQTGPSLALPSETLFVFGETVVEGGDFPRFFPNTEARVDPGHPCELEYARDDGGGFRVPIALTADEIAADQARTDGAHTELWPRGGFVAGDSGYVFYEKVTLSSFADVAELGTGVARFRAGEPVERLVSGRDAREPMLNWIAPDTGWGTGAILGRDGWAYVFGCYQQAAFDVGCRVARVEPSRIADASAYTYHDFDGNWSARVERASRVLLGATHVSGFYSDALGRYVLLYAEHLGNRIYAVTAPEPWGPFSPPEELATALAPQQYWIGRVDVHPAFASADGRRFVFGYVTDNVTAPGLHLVEAVLR